MGTSWLLCVDCLETVNISRLRREEVSFLAIARRSTRPDFVLRGRLRRAGGRDGLQANAHAKIGGVMRTLCFLILLELNTLSAVSQWTAPRTVDTAAAFFSEPCIAVGPHQEVAVVPLRTDTLVCYLSTNNGRTFSRSVIAYQWRSAFLGGDIGSVDGVGFDSQSNLFIFWRMTDFEEYTTRYSFRVSKSTDGGRTFSLFWAAHFFGGVTYSSLAKGGFFIDSQDRVHCVWDSVDSSPAGGTAYIYTSFLARDSTRIHNTILPALPASGSPASGDVFAQGNSVDIALSARRPVYPRAGLYYLHSTDAGITFSSVAPVDTLNARHPALVHQSNGALLLVHTSAPLMPPESYDDTALVIRRKINSLFSAPVLLVENLGTGLDPIAVRNKDSLLFIACTRYNSFPIYGVSYYELTNSGGVPADTLFLPGHHYPDLALDSLGGKYLVSVYQNRVYLSTKDVLLSVFENHEGPSADFHLGQNFPNPFNPQTRIPYEVYHPGYVEIVVHDLLGRVVTRLVNEEKPPGSYVAVWDASTIASGVYFYSLKVMGIVQSRKMMVMK